MERDKEFVRAMADYADAVLEAAEDIVSRLALWEMDIQRRIRSGEATDEMLDLRDAAYTCHLTALMLRDNADRITRLLISISDTLKQGVQDEASE
jgi:hypothetical protein